MKSEAKKNNIIKNEEISESEFKSLELNYRLNILEKQQQKLLQKLDTFQKSTKSLTKEEIDQKMRAFTYLKEEIVQKKRVIEEYLVSSENFAYLSREYERTQKRFSEISNAHEKEAENSFTTSYKYRLLQSLELYKDNIKVIRDNALNYFHHLKEISYNLERKRLDLKEKKFKREISKKEYHSEVERITIQKQEIRDKIRYLCGCILSFEISISM
ncbi:MAG: hypothetical protein GF311_05840 [Candidatus Lokiarchaeota archaeon]|nr:hypothetical protein [Candidatus Lokiarchaeota archaeon]